ncbi:MAG: hypothetical protein ABIT83_15415 [Massilia sp.]
MLNELAQQRAPNQVAQPAAAAGTARPSSLRRVHNLRILVAAFSERDLGGGGVVGVLDCSPSTARNYLLELMDARVIVPYPRRQPAGSADRLLYRLSDERHVVSAFLAELNRWDGGTETLCAPGDGERRDPLMAALFGR